MTNGLIKCIIVDDEEMAIRVLESHLRHVPDFEIVGTYHSAVEAFLVLGEVDIDVLFLDIQMPKMTGLAMLNMLKQPPLTVLTTAHREYALEGFELEAVDYLLKPISLNRLLQAVSRIQRRLRSTEIAGLGDDEVISSPALEPSSKTEIDNRTEEGDHVFIRSDRAFVKIQYNDIDYVEAIKNHIKVATKQETHISLMPISEFHNKLPDSFVRVHRSFLVNVHQILKFDNQSVFIEDKEIPIGRSYKKEVRQKLEEMFRI